MNPANRFRIRIHLTLALACLALILSASMARAKNGRDFAAHYEIQGVTDLGATVRVTLALRLVNFSGADVSSATVTVRDSLFMQKVLGTLTPSPLSVAKGRSVSLTGQITIPRREYDTWIGGTPPTAVLTQRTAAGKDITSRIELIERPLSEVQ